MAMPMMTLTLESSTHHELVKAIEENQFSFFRSFRDWPRIKVHDENDMRWLESDIPFPPLNGVWHTQLESEKVEATIQSLIEQAKSRNVPMLWWVGPTSQPTDLGSHLKRQGFVSMGQGPGMIIDLTTLNEHVSLPENLTIQKVTDHELLKTWGEVFVRSGLPEFMTQPVSERILYANPDILLTYMGWLDGKPVATSQMLLANGAAGMYNIATLPEARRRGIGLKMTLLPLLFARSQGYKIGVLTASEMGVGVYRSLGFKEICEINLYLWSPPNS